MNKSYWAVGVFALAATLYSCKKSSDTNTNFKVDGVQDVTVAPRTSDITLQVYITYSGSIKESVGLSLEGMPTGCRFSIDNAQGTPPFTAIIRFKDTAVVPGNYPLNLICIGSETGKQTYAFNLIANAEKDYRSTFVGTYSKSLSSCDQSHHYTIKITPAEEINKIYLSNLDNAGTLIYGSIFDSGQTIVIPEQTINGITFSGTGYPSYNNNCTFHLTKSDPNGSSTCAINLGN